MFNYLAVPDFHFHPDWMDVSLQCAATIECEAIARHVDAILFPGDFFDRAIYATDKGGINEARAIIRRLSKICLVAAIEGTPSHDYKGSYGPLEAEGLVMIRPGIAYGYKNGKICGWASFQDGRPEAMLFGIPEPTKEVYQAKHPEVSADKVNAAIVAAIDRIINEQIAPWRVMYPDIPMVGMFHGNVSDAIDRAAETNIILKASDIIIKTDSLALAHLNRWELAHIHTPWESSKISAGYAGFTGVDRNPWNKTGFVPAMNYVELEGTEVIKIERVPYGTAKRLIIEAPLASYDPNIAYWLKTDDPAAVKPEGHPWNRISYNEMATVSRRVDDTALELATTLPELAKLFDPEITEATLAVFREIEKTVARPALQERHIEVMSIEVRGAKFWNGETVALDISGLTQGLTQIVGANGSGKSALLGFCSPYPCFVGKDTESGRASAIKDFFQEPESGIKKTVIFNGQIHEHVITIRGAHTKTPKTECFLTIEGRPELEKATFDDMFAACERIYGTLADYLMTSFYVQPLQGKAESGLMTANMATVRDLVQKIAGREHGAEKDFALSKVREYEALTEKEAMLIENEAGLIPSIESGQERKKALEDELANVRASVWSAEQAVKTAETSFSAKKLAADREEERATRKRDLTGKALAARSEITGLLEKVEELKFRASRVPDLKTSLAIDETTKRVYAEAQTALAAMEARNAERRLACEKASARIREIDAEIRSLNAEADAAYRLKYSEWERLVADSKAELQRITTKEDTAYREAIAVWNGEVNKIERANQNNAAITREIALIKKPCPQCGYIDATVSERIKELESQIQKVEEVPAKPDRKELIIPLELLDHSNTEAPVKIPAVIPSSLTAERTSLIPQQAFAPETMTMPSKGFSDFDIALLKDKIEAALRADTERGVLVEQVIPSKITAAESLEREAAGITFEVIDMANEAQALADARKALQAVTDHIASLSSDIDHAQKLIDNIELANAALDIRRKKLAGSLETLSAWKRANDMLAPAKIPAMELEASLDGIDAEATRRVRPYRNGRYIFKSVTQKEGSKDIVDKFDIMIHDCETGRERSFLSYSVGEKSFFNDAYVKALVRVRTSRMKTSYSPIILDEADSFIEIPMIPQFYDIQKEYYAESNAKVLVVSHSPDAGNFIQNTKDMKDVMIYGNKYRREPTCQTREFMDFSKRAEKDMKELVK